MANPWWVVTYTSTGSGASQLGTVIVQASSQGAARTLAASKLPDYDQVGAARGPYDSQSAAASAGVGTGGGGKPVKPTPGTGGPNATPPSGGGQVTANPSNLQSAACLAQLPSLLGGGCIFTKTNARAVIAALMIAAGAGIAVVGLVVLAAQSKAGKAIVSATPAGRVASMLPT